MKILIITKNLLDLRDAQSQQSLALISALSEVFSHVDIICGSTNDFDFKNIKRKVQSNCNFYNLEANWIIEGSSIKDKIHRKIQRNLLATIPSKWVKHASKKANQLNRINNYKIILTIGLPIESNMVGLQLEDKRKWVSAFSDPWPESIMPKPYSDYSLKLINHLQKRIVQRIISESRNIIYTCHQSLELFKSHYSVPQEKCHVVPHVAPKKQPFSYKKNKLINITFSGSLSRERFFPELFIAISELPNKSLLHFNFIGNVHPAALKIIQDLNIKNRVTLIGQTTKEKTLEIIKDSNILMSIEAKMDSYPFLPSKIADYAAFGLPIFAITGENSATAILIKEHNAGYVSGHSKKEILDKFNELEKNHSEISKFSLYNFFDKEKIKSNYIDLANNLSNP